MSDELTVGDAPGLAKILAAEYRYSHLFQDDAYATEMLLHIARNVLKPLGQDERFALRVDGALHGVISRRVRFNSSFGCEVMDLFIAILPEEQSALLWAQSILDALNWQAKHTIVGRISAYHQCLLPVLADLGIGVDAVGLISSTETALNRLRSHYDLPADFSGQGLSHSMMKHADLDEVIELRRRAFERAPQYCWFGAYPAHLEFQRQRLAKDLAGEHAWWVIRDGSTVIGSFGSSITPNNPMWGPVGGMELIFDEGYVSKGMSKIAYGLTLSKLVSAGCSVFKGITAQAPVMHLGQIMGRALFDVHLRGPSDFKPAHFSLYLQAPSYPGE